MPKEKNATARIFRKQNKTSAGEGGSGLHFYVNVTTARKLDVEIPFDILEIATVFE
jgi:hypothetical protein